jgi:hypothetical protein
MAVLPPFAQANALQSIAANLFVLQAAPALVRRALLLN